MSELFTAKNARDLVYGKDHDILVRGCQAAWGKGKAEWHAMKAKLEELGYTVTKKGEDGSPFESPYTVISWE